MGKVLEASLAVIKKCEEDLKQARNNDKVIDALLTKNFGSINDTAKGLLAKYSVTGPARLLVLLMKDQAGKGAAKEAIQAIEKLAEENYNAAKQKRVAKQVVLDRCSSGGGRTRADREAGRTAGASRRADRVVAAYLPTEETTAAAGRRHPGCLHLRKEFELSSEALGSRLRVGAAVALVWSSNPTEAACLARAASADDRTPMRPRTPSDPSTLNDPNHDHDQGDDEENVNEAAHGVRCDESEQPEHEQHRHDGPHTTSLVGSGTITAHQRLTGPKR